MSALPSEQVTKTARRIWDIAIDSWGLNVYLREDEAVVYESAWEREFIERVEEELRDLLKVMSVEAVDDSIE